jgi:hypothetical protein
MMDGLKVGQLVKAFHPRTMGVVYHGRIEKVGWKYVHIDFGIWGLHKVIPGHIVDTNVPDYRKEA